MPPGDDPLPSQELADLAYSWLDHAVETITKHGELFPCAIIGEQGKDGLAIYMVHEITEQAVEHLRERAHGPSVDQAVIAYDGYITAEGIYTAEGEYVRTAGQRCEAVYVEAYERGRMGARLAQRYERQRQGAHETITPIGNVLYCDSLDPL